MSPDEPKLSEALQADLAEATPADGQVMTPVAQAIATIQAQVAQTTRGDAVRRVLIGFLQKHCSPREAAEILALLTAKMCRGMLGMTSGQYQRLLTDAWKMVGAEAREFRKGKRKGRRP